MAKNKSVEQVANKKRHLARLKRKTKPNLERREGHKKVKPSILIVCEGKNTEPSYFNHFRLTSATIEAIGEGYNTLSLVRRAKELASKKKYDQKWVVFDKDDFPPHDFDNAIIMAEANNFKVGYSNQAFEYWLLLHLNDHQGGNLDRRGYQKLINDALEDFNIKYEVRSKKVDPEFFEVLNSLDSKSNKKRVDVAIERAKRNIDFHLKRNISPSNAESSTTVYKLVEELTKYI